MNLIHFIFSLCLTGAVDAPQIEDSPRALVHLLDYLSKDYAGAVTEQGTIISQSEFSEQIEFSELAAHVSEKIARGESWKPILKDMQELGTLIRAHTAAPKVMQFATQVKNEVIQVSHLPTAPTQYPSAKRGEELYQANCASCHGVKGFGDGPAAATLDPKPFNFHDEKEMSERSPFQNFNVVRLGIPGTAMPSFAQLTDDQSWDLAFYIQSIRFREDASKFKQTATETTPKFSLEDLASLSDSQLKEKLPAEDKDKDRSVALLRIRPDQNSSGGSNGLQIAENRLNEAETAFKAGNREKALNLAAMGYLDGVEIEEPRLTAYDPAFVAILETAMAKVRSVIKSGTPDEFAASLVDARAKLKQGEAVIQKSSEEQSPWVIFSLAAGIVFREGFEAVLIILAILGVVRAAKATRAQHFVHGGWISAILLGIACWFFSGWLMYISGAQRELSEGFASLLAVVVLLYMGFWLHSKTEIKRWTQFIDTKVRTALEGSSRWGLFGLAFIAVFREAIETVLFLRALLLGGDSHSGMALSAAVFGTLAVIILLAWGLLRYSLRIPVRQLFAVSSWVMVALSIILVGKGFHSLQEVGMVSITSLNLPFQLPEFFGLYSTAETLIAQAAIAAVCVIAWYWTSKRSLSPSQ